MQAFNMYYTNEEDFIDFIGQQKISQALEKATSILVQIYSGVIETDKLRKILKIIAKHLPQAYIAGATTAGEILNGIVSKNKIAISITTFETTTIRVASFEKNEYKHVRKIVNYIAENLVQPNTKGILLHSNSFTYPADDLLNVFTEILPNIPVFGGAAGDNMKFQQQYVICNQQISTGIFVAVFNSDKLNISTDYHFNWQEIGKQFVVTKAKKHILKEINNEPALDIYKKYLGQRVAANLPLSGIEFPIIFDFYGVKVARVVMGINSKKELELSASVKNGDVFRFGYARIESILNKGYGIVETFKDSSTQVIWLFSCTARLSFLQEEVTQLELNPFKALPPSVGFFTYGEYFFNSNHYNLLLNDSLTIVCLSETDEKISEAKIMKAFSEVSKLNTLSKQSVILQGMDNLLSTVTNELNLANRELNSFNEEQKILLEKVQERNRIIEELNKQITDSIHYAKKIQNSLLPTEKNWRTTFPNSFILNKPKAIVSGDFYWIRQIGKLKYIAVADCVGHGVPGGFMSMLGISFLDEIVKEQFFLSPGEILNQLRRKIKNTLKQGDPENSMNDGMDISFCIIDETNKTICYAGAYNSLYLVRKKAENLPLELEPKKYKTTENKTCFLYDIKATRQPIATYINETPFDSQFFKFEPKDRIYMFSDGYADQIGAKTEKKYLTKNFKRLLLSVQDVEIKEQLDILDENLKNWQGNEEQIDDILVVGIELC